MERESLLSCSQEPATGKIPKGSGTGKTSTEYLYEACVLNYFHVGVILNEKCWQEIQVFGW
jgi:hypothetical protein